jgi:DNA-binding NarL/FixJ family response regulator
MTRVAIVDDHPVVRKGLRDFLREYADMEIVAEGANGRDAVAIARSGGVDVILMDISMPLQDGVGALAAIRARTRLPVLIVSSFPEEQYAPTLLRQGAAGYLNKGCDPLEIVAAIRTVARGRKYISGVVAELLAANLGSHAGSKPLHADLSERELQVFLRLARGETVGTIAERQSLSVKTVSTYRSRVMAKLRLATNSDLTRYAVENGLIE